VIKIGTDILHQEDGAKDKCVSLNMARYYKSQIPGSKLFIDLDGGHLARYKFEENILKTLTLND